MGRILVLILCDNNEYLICSLVIGVMVVVWWIVFVLVFDSLIWCM